MTENSSGTYGLDSAERARQSRGTSGAAIYDMVRCVLEERGARGSVIVDVGCGTGSLWPFVHDRFHRYIGADVVRYEGMPAEAEFKHVDLDSGRVGLPDNSGDVVAAVETIEHLENPRAFMRELVRLVKPGGWVIVTTPNQLSLLSKVTLLVRNQFNAFQEAPGLYPAHVTALLEVDLVRIATECGLHSIAVAFSHSGRVPLRGRHYPAILSKRFPRTLSDNVLMIGRKPNS